MAENSNEVDSKREELVIEAKKYFEYHKESIASSVRKGKNVVYVDFIELSEFSNKLAEEIVNDPEETFKILEQAIEQHPLLDKVRVRVQNMPESYNMDIREIRSRHLDNLVVVEGIIRQASDVRPQVVNAKFECPSCGTVISVMQTEKKLQHPTRCSCGRRGGFKLISKKMVDTQRLIVEETPESLSGGEQPKRLNVFVKEDLVEPKMEEKTTPGARVSIVGVLKEVPVPLSTGGISTRFELAIEANNLIPQEETFEELDISEEDERQIQELSQDPEVFKKLTQSIVPSVWGYEEIKRSLVLQLFGGVEKPKPDGQKNRGDIHILLIGDPGVAKSVTLGFMAQISPNGRYVVGKSTSGAGLTASVVRDEYLKGWSLEAGAMVLANRGLVCIDELEKMDPDDRSAMHEAMEQQTVTVSKANVQATLRAETSVLAAANPKFGRFDPYQSIPQQIDIPPTLINRFDIIFTLRDTPDKKNDERVASHVLKEHQTRESAEMLVPRELFRKYVAYAKQKVNPVLSDEATRKIKNFYIDLRNRPVSSESEMRPIPISARQLQALVRMAEASARARLSETVEPSDADEAIEIMKHYLMQVGYDYESETFDIDRISSGYTSSQRNKIMTVKETIMALSEKMGKEIPMEEVKEDLKDKMQEHEIQEAVDKLIENSEIYRPKRGYIGIF